MASHVTWNLRDEINQRVKSAQIRSYFWCVISCIQTRNCSVFGHFREVTFNFPVNLGKPTQDKRCEIVCSIIKMKSMWLQKIWYRKDNEKITKDWLPLSFLYMHGVITPWCMASVFVFYLKLVSAMKLNKTLINTDVLFLSNCLKKFGQLRYSNNWKCPSIKL